ncbi:MAG TPA: dUTP diphosphatase [Aliidongia sp.]|uniref:dUTP diphosphatase n=1 Tax=Aliidongia sp. TaxID=1914230 RepID=UPI002DDCCCDB|nr:dUTP diphosphatase [Aliidongia sp.]HEV2674968.1 dUTP diphosphatase [Aliidongia sp.]
MSIQVPVLRLPHAADLSLPTYATPLSAGVDLRAAIDQTLILPPLGRIAVPTGIAIALPAGYEAQVRPRSGLALNEGVTVLNSPGTIDADYRGEIKVILINLSHRPFAIERGQRIAQLVVAPVIQIGWQEVHVLEKTERGDGGHGSTGSM